MLQTQGLDPFTQSAAYYRLIGDAPKANAVEVSVQNASRDTVYAPASMEKVTDGDVYERRDALLKGRGLFGTRNYTVTEVSGTRPSELMVAESWVSSPQTEEQTAYAQAESVYRSFVYDAYTAVDEDLLPVVKNVAAVGFGIVSTVILLFTLLLCAMELTRAFLLWDAERRRRRMSIEERVRQSQKLIFKLIALWGIDAALG